MRIPEELLPVVEWWEKDGKQTVAVVAVAALAVAGYFGVKSWRERQNSAASDALLTINGAGRIEELESAVAGYQGTVAAPSLRMRLAMEYFNAGRYEEALAEYEKLDGSAPDGFGDVPSVGRAQCLEALGRYEEALKSFEAMFESKPKSFLALSARIGAARCAAQLGDREGALARLAAARDTLDADDESGRELVESAEALVKRWEKRTLFDTADDAAQQVAEASASADASDSAAAAPAEETPSAQ